MKLVINIPCLNEEDSLPKLLTELPQEIKGVDEIEVQVIDDGSKDRTSEIAKEHGCWVIRHKRNQGLGNAFKTGIDFALANGADIMVNTDGDNQYPSRYIAELIRPILDKRADIVIGNRSPWALQHFSLIKRALQRAGNTITRRLAGVTTPDMISGFRAYSREAMLQLNPSVRYSYTLDTIVQASKKGLEIASIDINVNLPTRPSRLYRNTSQYVITSAAVILRAIVVYEAFKTFLFTSVIFGLPGLILMLRFLRFYLMGDGSGHVQSLILASVLIIISGLLFALGILADLIAKNRRLIEEELYLLKKKFYEQNKQR